MAKGRDGEKIAIIVGAGATVSDCASIAKKSRPPLDRGFFDTALVHHASDLKPVVDFMRQHYGVDDLRSASMNSLERVMAVLYTDSHGTCGV